jgi:putative glutamine amidotransferase
VHIAASSELPPRIGLTTYRERAVWGVWDEPADLLPANYSDAIDQAGGLPILLPSISHDVESRAEAALNGLDGLLLAGGADIEPTRYGAERDGHTGPARIQRDDWEIALARCAIRRTMPVLGICRGMQILNVALGGTLIQHLPDHVGNNAHCLVVGVHNRHVVRTAPGSRIESIQGPRSEVSTYHHQAVDNLAPGFIPTAWADDDTVEAAELLGPARVLGVQWHPEAHNGALLFKDFVTDCATWRHTVSVSSDLDALQPAPSR